MIKKYKVGEYGLENETEGMYARTDNGIIGKILNSNSDEMINGPELLVNNKIYCIESNSIKEIKENIIDLIEVGDFVNKYLVVDKYLFNGEKTVLETTGNYKNAKCLCNGDIKTIWTKEQLKTIEYNV